MGGHHCFRYAPGRTFAVPVKGKRGGTPAPVYVTRITRKSTNVGTRWGLM
jgi:hypothetical protein